MSGGEADKDTDLYRTLHEIKCLGQNNFVYVYLTGQVGCADVDGLRELTDEDIDGFGGDLGAMFKKKLKKYSARASRLAHFSHAPAMRK